MTVNYTTNLALAQPVTGTESGTWGDDVNNGLTSYLDIAISGSLALTSASFTANALTLANTQGTSSSTGITTTTAQYYVLRVSSLAANVTITAPSLSKSYIVVNLDPTYTVTLKASGQTGVTVPVSSRVLCVFNGTDYAQVGSSSGGLTYVVKTSTYTATDKQGVLANTSGGAFTVNLPASPTVGAQVVVADDAGTWGTNNLTIGRNGSTIASVAQDLVCDINGVSVQLVYDGSTWVVYAQVGGNPTNPLAVAQGGTGATTLTGVLKGNGTSAVTAGTVSLTSEVAGTLPIANGGTNSTATATAGGVGYGTGTAYAFTAAGTSGQVLTSAGSGAPVWAAASSGMTLVSTQNGASTNSLSWTGLSGSYTYLLVFNGLTSSGFIDNVMVRAGSGGSIVSSGYTYYGFYYTSSATLNYGASAQSGVNINGNNGLTNPSGYMYIIQTPTSFDIVFTGATLDANGTQAFISCSKTFAGTLTNIQVANTSRNWTGGSASLYKLST